jgi:uncharacterized protein (TIGR03435 family)
MAATTAAMTGLIVFGLAYSQSAPVFEVASIKLSRNRTSGNFTDIAPGGQRFTANNASLKLLILTAYDVTVRQVSGGPGWLSFEVYDIEAKTERPASPQQIHAMLQALLADRFKLKLH